MSIEIYHHTLHEFEKKYNAIVLNGVSQFAYYSQCVALCRKYIKLLLVQVEQNQFANAQDEVYFFKHLLPKINSKLIYCYERESIEGLGCRGFEDMEKEVLRSKLQMYVAYYDNNREFYRYYLKGSCELDHIYFLRKNDLICDRCIEGLVTGCFITSYSQILAYFMAYEDLKIFVSERVTKYANLPKRISLTRRNIQWSVSKTDVVELAYAFHSSKCCNNGKISIKELVAHLCKFFNVEVDNYYRTFSEIKNRKKSLTPFMDHLISSLVQKINEDLD